MLSCRAPAHRRGGMRAGEGRTRPVGAPRSIVGSWRLLSVVLLSFASGLPLGLVWIAIPAWLARAGVDIKTIGLITLVQAPCSLKLQGAWTRVMRPMVLMSTPARANQAGMAIQTRPSGSPEAKESRTTESSRQLPTIERGDPTGRVRPSPALIPPRRCAGARQDSISPRSPGHHAYTRFT